MRGQFILIILLFGLGSFAMEIGWRVSTIPGHPVQPPNPPQRKQEFDLDHQNTVWSRTSSGEGMSGMDSTEICTTYHLAFHAEQLYRSRVQLDEAVDLYIQALDQGLNSGSIILDALTAANGIEDFESAKTVIQYGLQLGFTCADYNRLWPHVGNNQDYDHLINSADTSFYIKIYESRLVDSLISQLAAMSERDQLYRSRDEFEDHLQRQLDSLNWSALKTMVQSLGYLPTRTQLGMDGSSDLSLLFHHMDKNELEWFLPYVIQNIQEYESDMGSTVLYQLERVGMADNMLYTISEDLKIQEYAPRTIMQNGIACQSFGEKFFIRHRGDKKNYYIPFDPGFPLVETNRIRRLFCLDSIQSSMKRWPWIETLTISEFEQKFTNLK